MRLFLIIFILSAYSTVSAQIIKEKKTEEKKTVVYDSAEEIPAPLLIDDRNEDPATGPFIENGKVGYKINDKVVVLPNYQELREQEGKNILIAKLNDKWGAISKSGDLLIPHNHKSIYLIDAISKPTYKVKSEKGYGVLSASNEIIISAEYEYIRYSYGFYEVDSARNAMAIFSLEGNRITDFVYEYFFELNINYDYYGLRNDSGYAILKKDLSILIEDIPKLYGIGYFNYFNQLLEKPKDDSDYSATKRYILIQNDKMGVYDFKTDSFTIPQIYDDFYGEEQSNFIFSKSGKKGIVDIKNKVQVDFKYDSIFFEGQNLEYNGKVAIVSLDGKLGLVDAITGVELTEIKYLDLSSLYEGKYKARLADSTYVVLSEDGSVLNSGPFTEVGEFALGSAMVFTKTGIKTLSLDGSLTQNEFNYHDGYKDTKAFFEAFKAAMYSNNDDLLMDFCEKIAPSAHIIKFMERIGIEYRRFPQFVTRKGNTVDQIALTYFDHLNHIRTSYFIDDKPEISFDLSHHLTPKVYHADKSGRHYIELEMVLTIGDNIAEITFDHCIIIEGFIISFSDSVKH